MSEAVIYALAAVLAGLALGAALGALTRRVVAAQERRRSVEGLAGPAAAFVFWVVLAIGIGLLWGSSRRALWSRWPRGHSRTCPTC